MRHCAASLAALGDLMQEASCDAVSGVLQRVVMLYVLLKDGEPLQLLECMTGVLQAVQWLKVIGIIQMQASRETQTVAGADQQGFCAAVVS